MCTAISDGRLCGRTLDLEYSYGEQVVITPRDFPFTFRYEGAMPTHPAIIGMAHVADGIPLYYDAMSETGLAVCGLRFATSCVYHPPRAGRHNLASYELIPRLLGVCRTVEDAVAFLKDVTVTPDSISPDLPTVPLHWLVADRKRAVVVESVAEGLAVYDDPVAIMTNQPPFPYHMARLAEMASLSSAPANNTLCPTVGMEPPLGTGSVGLPGDTTSSSRFLRAVYAKYQTLPTDAPTDGRASTPWAAVSRFFHLMDTVSVPRGCAVTADGHATETVYTACMDLSTCTYYFTTYGCRRIRGVAMGDTIREGTRLRAFPIGRDEDILMLPG